MVVLLPTLVLCFLGRPVKYRAAKKNNPKTVHLQDLHLHSEPFHPLHASNFTESYLFYKVGLHYMTLQSCFSAQCT